MYAARLGSSVPSLANLVTQKQGLPAFANIVAGVHGSRQLPRSAPATFREAQLLAAGLPRSGHHEEDR